MSLPADANPARRPLAAGGWVVALKATAERAGPALAGERELLRRPPWRLTLGAGEEVAGSIAVAAGWGVIVAGNLLLPGEAAPRAADAAAVVAWLHRGAGARLAGLRGRFALIAWDSERQRLLALRDATGGHPLFYARRGADLLLSPRLEALAALPGVSPVPHRGALADALAHRWPGREETAYRHLRRLLPGHLLTLGPHGLRVTRYWDPEAAADAEEPATGFAERLAAAVRPCLPPGPAGVFLSGGLDSVSVALVARDEAAHHGLPPPRAFGLAFPHPEADESAMQRRVAGELGLPLTLVGFPEALAGRGVLEAAVDLAAEWPWPLFNPWAPAYLALGRAAARRGVTTVLTGGGGDEWLGISPFHAGDLLAVGDLAGFLRLGRGLGRSYRLQRSALWRQLLWRFGLRPLLAARLGRLAPSLLSRRRARRFARAEPPWLAPEPGLRRELDERLAAACAITVSGSLYRHEVRNGLDHALVSLDAEEQDEMGRRSGVEIRQPFWDPDLVAALYRLSPDALLAGGRAKSPLRELVAQRLPGLGPELGRRRKVLATRFFRDCVLAEGAAQLVRLGGLDTLGRLGIVDAAAAAAELVAICRHRDENRASHVWDLLIAESWLRARGGGG